MATENKPKRPLLDAIRAMEIDDVIEETRRMSDEEIAADLASAGVDPKAAGERGAAHAKLHLERRKRLAWQVEAREKLAAAREKLGAAPASERLPRAVMIARIEAAQREASLGLQLAARKGGIEAASDDELASILEEIELLRTLHKP